MIRKKTKKNKHATPFNKLSQNVWNGQIYLQLKITLEVGNIYLH